MVLNFNLARASYRSGRELGEFRKAKSGIQDGTDFFEGLGQGFRGVRLPNERPDETARLAAGPGTCRGEGSWLRDPGRPTVFRPPHVAKRQVAPRRSPPTPKCRPVGNAHGPTWEKPIDRLYQGGFAQTSVSPALKHAMYDPGDAEHPQGPGSQALTPTVLYTCLTGAGLTFSRQRAHVSLDRGWHRVGVLTVAHFEEELGDGCLYAEGGVAHVTPLGSTTQSQHQAVQVSVFFRLAKPFACPLPEQGSSQRPFIDTTGQMLFIHDRHDRPCSREATSGDKKHLKELQHNHNQNSSLSH